MSLTKSIKKIILRILIFIIFDSFQFAHGITDDFPQFVTGMAASVILHESGHALTTHLLGGEIEEFRPYPQKIRYLKNNGIEEDQWVLGLVRTKGFEGENSQIKTALTSAMGSGFNLLSVFLFAPLLPKIHSPFAKESLDHMLFISCFDWPAYVLGDLYFNDGIGDWKTVSKYSGISLYTYLAMSIASSLIVNQYRMYWHHKAAPAGSLDYGPLTVGFRTSF